MRDVIYDYSAGETLNLVDVYNYIGSTLGGAVTQVENFVDVNATDGILRVHYVDSGETPHSVDLAILKNYTGALSVQSLTAYDSVYYYHTSTHSIAKGLALTNPFDQTTLFPSVLVDGSAGSHTIDSSTNGTGSFTNISSPDYNFAPTDSIAFEATDSVGSFTYIASNGGTPASGNVEIKSYTSGDNKFLGGYGNDVLLGSDGVNNLSGGAGNDILFGMDGNDTFYGGEGDDLISGGDGSDNINYFLAHDDGQDMVEGGDGTDTFRMIETGDNIEYINITAGADNTILMQDALSDLTDWSDARTQTLKNIEYINVYGFSGGSAGFDVTASGDLAGVYNMNFSSANDGTITVDASGVTSSITGVQVNGSIGDDILHGGAGNDTFTLKTQAPIFSTETVG